MINRRNTLGHFEFCGGVKDGNKSFHDHIVQLGLGITEFNDAPRRNNGKVVGYFGIVKDALVEADFVFFEGFGCPGSSRMAGLGDLLSRL